MLARTAQGLYWMGRYLERSRHLCRMLQIQMSALIDRPIPEIQFGWSRIFGSLKMTPHGGLLTSADDDFTLVDAYTLAGELTFVRNGVSVMSCFELGRENARQMRHCLSGEIWSILNMNYLLLQDVQLNDIWQTEPEQFYATTENGFRSVLALTSAAMYRDEAWRFIQLGRFLERAQATASLLIAHDAAGGESSVLRPMGIRTLLRTLRAEESFNRVHGYDPRQDRAFHMLVSDAALPASLSNSVGEVVVHLEHIRPGDTESSRMAVAQSRQIAKLIDSSRPELNEMASLVSEIETSALSLHNHIDSGYFSYEM